MGRIITRKDGSKFHVGGRLQPKVSHGIKLHDPKYGLNLASWPATPSSTSYGAIASAQPVLTDVLGNDQLGDCTEADNYHRQALRQAASGGTVFHPTLAQVIATYSRDGGYVPGDPSTDQGCDELTVLRNAKRLGITNGSAADKITGYVVIDPTNVALVRKCVSAFVGASICMGLPDVWIDPFPAAPGWTWDVPSGGFVPNPQNGHCFTLADQDETALECWSWAMRFTLTYDALAAGASDNNGGGLYVILDQEILDRVSQAAPDGLDWACLQKDFDSVAC